LDLLLPEDDINVAVHSSSNPFIKIGSWPTFGTGPMPRLHARAAPPPDDVPILLVAWPASVDAQSVHAIRFADAVVFDAG